MKCSFELSPSKHLIADIVLQTIMQIVILSFFAYYKVESYTPDDLQKWKGLSLAGAIFFMLSQMGTCLLNYKFHKYALIGLLCLQILSIFLQLIGMGLGSKQVVNGQYNYPVAYWFMELMIFFLCLVNLHTIKQQQIQEAPKPKEQPATHTIQNQSQLNMVGNNESQFTQQQQVV